MLRKGDLIPQFHGATADGREVQYRQLWQHRNLVLFVLSADLRADASSYLGALEARLAALSPPDTSLLISDRVDGLPQNAVGIADRWGEIIHLEQLAADRKAWPSSDDILEWVEFVRLKCPECPP